MHIPTYDPVKGFIVHVGTLYHKPPKVVGGRKKII